MRQTSVRSRLLWSFLAVALTGGVVFAVATRMLVPRLFDHTMGSGQGLGRPDGAGSGSGIGGGPGGGTGGGGTGGGGQIITVTGERDAVVSAVNTATAIALAATLLMALVLAIFLSRRGETAPPANIANHKLHRRNTDVMTAKPSRDRFRLAATT